MATRTAPASFEAFVREYDHFIDVTIYKISRGAVRADDLADLKQAIYTRVWETGYLEKYSPDRGSFSNYLYCLIRSVLVNQFAKNLRNPLNHAYGVRAPGSPVDRLRIILEAHKDQQDAAWCRRMEAADLCRRLEAVAPSLERGADIARLLRLLYEGYTSREAAALMQRPFYRMKEHRRQLRQALQVR